MTSASQNEADFNVRFVMNGRQSSELVNYTVDKGTALRVLLKPDPELRLLGAGGAVVDGSCLRVHNGTVVKVKVSVGVCVFIK